jgi:DNA-binding GntR family transcriptional regulator
VTGLNKETITNFYECRAVLEGMAAKKAACTLKEDDYVKLKEYLILARQYFHEGQLDQMVNKNTLFHETILKLSESPPLIQMMEQVKAQVARYRTITSTIGFRTVGFDEHTAILNSLIERDSERAEQLMKRHIMGALCHGVNVWLLLLWLFGSPIQRRCGCL